MQITDRLRIELEDCFNRCKNNLIVYRERKLTQKEFSWLKQQKNLQLVAVENLHAKCYLNETRALITSMNLYEYSQINNHELGVYISGKDDADQYLSLLNKIQLILRTSGKSFDFSELVDEYGSFTMGDLVNKLNQNFRFNEPRGIFNANYVYLCREAKKIVRFSRNQMYQDGTNVLRTTDLGKEKFDMLYDKLKKLGVRK